MASVNGVVVPWASMVKVRSNTDSGLHSGGEFQDAAVRAGRAGHHEPDRHLAFAMARFEIAQPSIMLISVQLRSDSTLALVNAFASARSAIRGGVLGVSARPSRHRERA